MNLIQKYCDNIGQKLQLNIKEKEEIIKEIKTHLEDLVLEFKKGGLSMEKAQKKAIENFGKPQKIARGLQWVHGFGKFSENRLADALLGAIPFALSLVFILLMETQTINRNSYLFAIFWIPVIVISVYAFKKGIPCWTITWLGFLNVIIFQLLFFYSYYLSPLLPIFLLSSILVFLLYLISRHDIRLTLLFVLPLAIPYVLVSYDDVVLSHRILMEILVVLFTITVSFILLYFRLKFAYLIAGLGFCLYSFIYFDSVFFAPLHPSFEKNYLGLVPTLLGYIIPLLVIAVVPLYYYFRQKSSDMV